MTEGMSPSTIERNIEEMDTHTAQYKKTDGDNADEGPGGREDVKGPNGCVEGGERVEEVEGDDTPPPLKTEKRKGPEGEMEITHSGPTLTQAEVEAGQKTVSTRTFYSVWIESSTWCFEVLFCM